MPFLAVIAQPSTFEWPVADQTTFSFASPGYNRRGFRKHRSLSVLDFSPSRTPKLVFEEPTKTKRQKTRCPGVRRPTRSLPLNPFPIKVCLESRIAALRTSTVDSGVQFRAPSASRKDARRESDGETPISRKPGNAQDCFFSGTDSLITRQRSTDIYLPFDKHYEAALGSSTQVRVSQVPR